MKIISIGPANPLRGGIAKFNESFALASLEKGLDIEIISFKFLYPGFLFPGKTQFSSDPPPEKLKIYPWLHSLNPFNWILISRKIRLLYPDLVVIHYWMPFFAPVSGFLARRIRKNSHAKVIGIAHNLIPHEKQAFSKCLSKYFLNSLDGLVCLSSAVLKDAVAMNKSLNSFCLPHPVYDIYGDKTDRITALNHLKLDPSKKYLLFFGLIRKYKGLELMLRSFARVSNEKLILLVAGEFYEDKSGYFSLAEELGISNRVIFTDSFIPDSEVKYYFSAADLIVQPYLTATQSGVTQIAYHFDCPMLVTNTGGLPEIVIHEKTGFVCEKDPSEIAFTINRFFNDNMSADMISNVKLEKKRFSWEFFVDELLKKAS